MAGSGTCIVPAARPNATPNAAYCMVVRPFLAQPSLISAAPHPPPLQPAFWMFPTELKYGVWAASGEVRFLHSTGQGSLHLRGVGVGWVAPGRRRRRCMLPWHMEAVCTSAKGTGPQPQQPGMVNSLGCCLSNAARRLM